MAKRKTREIARLRTIVVYRNGKLGYYSRDRIEGGISPTYASDADLIAARRVRTGANGAKVRWPAAS